MQHAIRQPWSTRTLALAGSLASATPTHAAPPGGDLHAAEAVCAEAERRSAIAMKSDTRDTIALYDQCLARIPEDPGYAPYRGKIVLAVVKAHEDRASALEQDGAYRLAIDHLKQAKDLLDRYLGPLDLFNEQARVEAEARRADLERKLAATDQRARDVERARQAAMQEAAAAAARRSGRTLTIAGSILSGLGITGLALMGVGLGLGRSADRRIDALKADKAAAGDDWADPCLDMACRDERHDALDPLLTRGDRGNKLVIGGAVLGGTLAITGAVLLLIGRRRALGAAPRAGAGFFGVTLTGQF